MRWVCSAKTGGEGEGKAVVFRSKLKWVGVFGLVLSAFSLFTHFLLARYSDGFAVSEYKSSITIFSWRPTLEDASFSPGTPLHTRLWAPVRVLESIHPYANPRGDYVAPDSQSNGFMFVRIRGGFHEIRNSICDVVAVARLLNATLVIPEIQSTTSSKGISTEFKSFAYLYSEDRFIAALADDVRIVKSLPKDLKGAKRKREIPSFKVAGSASPHFYLRQVLPVLSRHSVVELLISDGGCLQARLPPQLEEYQRLRCRVAFHALRFRQEVEELTTTILSRLRASGRPFIAYDPGMTRDALAYHGCAELFQDVHTELIQHKRAWMIKRGIVKGNLSVNSAERRRHGYCPLMPEEIGIILRTYGYSSDTIIYVSGGEVFGGQKKLIPLHAMFENVVDRTSLSFAWELTRMYGHEADLVDPRPTTHLPVKNEVKTRPDQGGWKFYGPLPRPLPPPPARPKYPYNIEGWWGWVAESDDEPESTVAESRANAHKMLWEAIDYAVCVEADVFVPGFDRDGRGDPNFASLVMGHRLYRSAASKTFRIDRKEVARLLNENRDHVYRASRPWLKSLRKLLTRSLFDGLIDEQLHSKPMTFLSFPVPECSCSTSARRFSSWPINNSNPLHDILRTMQSCPSWMGPEPVEARVDDEDNVGEDQWDLPEAGLLFRQGGQSDEVVQEANGKDEVGMEDSEEVDGGGER